MKLHTVLLLQQLARSHPTTTPNSSWSFQSHRSSFANELRLWQLPLLRLSKHYGVLALLHKKWPFREPRYRLLPGLLPTLENTDAQVVEVRLGDGTVELSPGDCQRATHSSNLTSSLVLRQKTDRRRPGRTQSHHVNR